MKDQCKQAVARALGKQTLTAKEATDIEAKINQAMKNLAKQDIQKWRNLSPNDRLVEAGKQVAIDIMAEVKRKNKIAANDILIQSKNLNQLDHPTLPASQVIDRMGTIARWADDGLTSVHGKAEMAAKGSSSLATQVLRISGLNALDTNKSCGVFLKSAQSAVSTQLTCEKNAIGLIAYFCPTTISSFYSELNTEYTLLANASNVSVNTISGYFDNRSFRIQNNAAVTVMNYDAGSLSSFTPNIIEYEDEKNRLFVLNGFNYFAKNVIYQNYDKIIYVDSNTGNDIYTGFNKNYPCKTLNKALEIASSVTSDNIMLYNKCTIVVNGGSHVVNNINLPNAELVIKSGNTVANINFNTDSSFRLINSKVEIINCVVNVDKSYGWASYGGAGLNVLILRDCVTNLSNNACILYSNTDATTHFYLASSVVNGGAGECIAIIPNDSLATLELKCGASVSSAITSRSDKGLNLNRDNAIKIFPAAFR